MLSGRIMKGVGGFYCVKAGNAVYECKARGIFRKENIIPLPGDNVNLVVLDEDVKTGSIIRILPRRNELVRPAVANVDQLAVVAAVNSPSPDFQLVDKLLLTAEFKGIPAIICINKIDLGTENEYQTIKKTYDSAGYRVVLLNTPAKIGFDELLRELRGRETVFAGQSGVGKSAIMNAISEARVMQTGEISSKISRGKHTTRHAELIELSSGGLIVDTPGFSSIELSEVEEAIDEKLELYYPEFKNYLNTCRFKGCSHISEPGCQVRQALKDGLIDSGRYERYTGFYAVLKELKDNRYKLKRLNNQERK